MRDPEEKKILLQDPEENKVLNNPRKANTVRIPSLPLPLCKHSGQALVQRAACKVTGKLSWLEEKTLNLGTGGL